MARAGVRAANMHWKIMKTISGILEEPTEGWSRTPRKKAFSKLPITLPPDLLNTREYPKRNHCDGEDIFREGGVSAHD